MHGWYKDGIIGLGSCVFSEQSSEDFNNRNLIYS